jgi:BirA family biotin operon repressor/biotin-[acetyl-CoA-carboxylase] ligase
MKEKILQNLDAECPWRGTLHWYSTIDSTNTRAKAMARDGAPHGTVLIASHQTGGRGRMGRSFFSTDNKGVYMTVVFKAPEDDAFLRITAISAVCAVESIKELFGISTEIKWVNDIIYKSKKVAGILAESFVVGDERYVAVGFGINLYTQIPDDLRDIAISIFPEYPDSYTLKMQRDALANRITEKLLAAIEKDDCAEYMTKYRALSCIIGNDIVFTQNGCECTAHAFDINDKGALGVKLDGDLTIYLSSGEISIKKF